METGQCGVLTESYRLPAGVGYWTGTGAARQEEPEDSGRKHNLSFVSSVGVCTCACAPHLAVMAH